LTDLGLVKIKYNLFLSNQMVQRTAPLTILTTIASLKEYKSLKSTNLAVESLEK
jgi:hypothetical protein